MSKLEGFRALGLSPETLEAIGKKGFEEPTPIQQQIIPVFLEKECDIVGQAQTGTGKTAAFGLPLLEHLKERARYVQTLILTPTRELAIQVAEEINSLKGKKDIQVAPIYGGQSIDLQFAKLKRGIDIVVGTPGRVIDHLKRGTLKLAEITHMILDEADEMLNMGFIEDVEEIIRTTNENKRVLLFSATMPTPILNLARRFMRGYELIAVKKEQLTADLTDQIYFEVASSDRFEALCRIVDVEPEFYGLIFCRTKIDVDLISNKLNDRGYDAEALHGDISQKQRERILNDFKRRRVTMLVATDVAARGIDVADLTHVINYSLPQDPESYVHRIGRTGRAGKEGTAITFITPDEYRKLSYIKKIANTNIRKEKLPGVDEIIHSKKQRIRNKIVEAMDQGGYSGYVTLAMDILQDKEPIDVVSAMLKYYFQDQLDESNYGRIRDVSGVNRTGRARLFVALGRQDGMTPRKLIEYLREDVDIESSLIQDIRIMDNFSFLTVPFEDAELILDVFKKKSRGKRPVVDRAREKNDRRRG